MISRYLLTALFCLSTALLCRAQNFSGLQDKRLNKVEDIGSALESLLSRIGGNIEGSIDSVVVLGDTEKELRLRIYYSGYQKGFFKVSTMNSSRQQEDAVNVAKFTQTTSVSPVECVLNLKSEVPGESLPESPYLRIDIAKKEGGSGKVKIFDLRKKWVTTVSAKNLVIPVFLKPVGVAERLTNVPLDVEPPKKIIFEQNAAFKKSIYTKPAMRTIKPVGGGNSLMEQNPADLSGTWNNIDPETNGLTKLIIAGNQLRVFSKCSPQDCEMAKIVMNKISETVYNAVFTNVKQKNEFQLNLVGADLQVIHTSRIGFMNYRKTYTFKRNMIIKYNGPKIMTLDQFTVLQPPKTGPVDRNSYGPDKNLQLYLWNELTVDNQVDFSRPQEISNINMTVYADKNPNSGVYYITPADYHLRWEEKPLPRMPEDGYELNILYGSQGDAALEDAGTDAPVRMSAKLTAGISNSERAFVKSILKALRPDFTDIRFLPLRDNIETTFPSTLSAQFGVPSDKVTVISGTDFNNDITVAWRTDADTKEFIQTALTSGEGIAANIILKPKDESMVDVQLPAVISLADTRSLGKMTLEPMAWRTRNWRNATPYPLQLRYLHVLKKQISGNKLIVYSWSLDNIEVPSRAQIDFDDSKVPTWLDNDPTAVMWLDYSVSECNDCDQKVMSAVTGGVFGNTAQQIKFTIAPAVFDTLKASYFKIYLRSPQADPKGELMKELEPLSVTNDGAKQFTVGPLFTPPGTSLNYEYRITVASSDGDFYPSNQWIRASDKEVLLGKTFMKELFKGIIPGLD